MTSLQDVESLLDGKKPNDKRNDKSKEEVMADRARRKKEKDAAKAARKAAAAARKVAGGASKGKSNDNNAKGDKPSRAPKERKERRQSGNSEGGGRSRKSSFAGDNEDEKNERKSKQRGKVRSGGNGKGAILQFDDPKKYAKHQKKQVKRILLRCLLKSLIRKCSCRWCSGRKLKSKFPSFRIFHSMREKSLFHTVEVLLKLDFLQRFKCKPSRAHHLLASFHGLRTRP